MKILAFEFSSSQRSVAVLDTALGTNAPVMGELIETGVGAMRAVGMAEAVLQAAKLEPDQIDCVAVGLGPGSYTGIRGILALAQGWQLAREVKLLGISSVEAVIAQVHADGITGAVSVVIDAQRDELYLAGYTITINGWQETAPLRLASLDEARSREKAGDMLVGPEVTRWFAGGKTIFPRAAYLGQLARTRTDYMTGDKLEPIYLRETSFLKAPPPRVIPA